MEGRHSLGRRNSWARIFGLVVLLVVAGGSTVLGWIPPSSSDPGVPAAGTVVASGEPVTRTYQKGDGGSFSETDDAYISSTAPDTNFGAATELHVDGSGCHVSPATVCKALIRFPSFIGGDPAQVPTGSSVVSATLQLTITNPGTTEDLYQVTDSWGADWVTWNSFSSAGSPATRARESVFAPRPLGLIAINIRSIVQRWVNLEPNDGILLASSDPDGVVYESSESANRPLLTVQFIQPSFVGPLPTVDLGTLPGDTDSQAHAINEIGQIVGGSQGPAPDSVHAFLWDAGTMTDLGTLGGSESEAFGINDAGQVVGRSTTASGDMHAFLWDASVMSDLGTLNAPYAEAYGINDAGQVVGTSPAADGSPHGVLWQGGAIVDLGSLDGLYSHALQINARGQVAGRSSAYGADYRGFLWFNGTMTDLGSLDGPMGYSEAYGINAAGHVVGRSYGATGDHAFLWDAGTMTDLGTLGGYSSVGVGINDRGQVIGWSGTATGYTHAFLWDAGGLADLGTLGGYSSEAHAINDATKIVGVSQTAAGNHHATLWIGARPAAWSISEIGTLPGHDRSVAYAINEAGQVVGESCAGPTTQCHAFLWDAGTMTDLGTLGGVYSAAYGVNDAGRVVGQSSNATGAYHAFLWDAGVMTDLGTLGGTASAAFSISDAGRVVGWSETEPGSYPPHHAFLWEAGTMTDLGTLGGNYASAFDINEAGQVVGSSNDTAFLWENGTMMGLGTLGCPVYSEAFGVNDAGRVVGWSADPSCDLRHAIVWDAGVMSDLRTLPGGYFSEARAINDAGQIVGQSMNGSGGYPAALWENGTIVDLGTLPGDNRAEAMDINDAGQIVGLSLLDVGPKHAVLWAPSSPPASGPSTLSFQKGNGGAYSEADDTYISSGLPNANYGAGPAMFVDASGCKVAPASMCKALVKFPRFVGSNAGQVKPGSVIVSAFLQIEITNPGGTQVLYQLTEDWTELGATWNSFATPGSPGTKGTGLSFNAPLGVITLNITAIVQNWVNEDANDGLLIWSSSADGVDYRSSESANPPTLTVTFRSP